jgi:RNA polymerase sigma factor (sigma-70 family)
MGPQSPDAFLPTRRSLLSRLKDWRDEDSWREFFETYWRLIYDVALRTGLDDAAAQDVVQETVLAAAKQLPGFKYDPSKGSFKAWLLQITRRRIAESLRVQYRAKGRKAGVEPEPASDNPGSEESEAAGPPEFDALWDAEWNSHLAEAVMQRLKSKVNPKHFQAFELLTVQGWSPMEVSRTLGINIAQVYLIRSRVRRLVKDEAAKLENGGY